MSDAVRYVTTRCVLVLAIGLAGLAGCTSEAQSVIRTAASPTAMLTGGLVTEEDVTDTLQTVLSILTEMANEIGGRSRTDEALAAMLYGLAASDFVVRQHADQVLGEVCSLPGPDDLPEVGTEFEIAADIEEEGAILHVSADLGEAELPVAVELHADAESASVHVRGGGWLICALFVTDIFVDGELLDVSSIEAPNPSLEADAWPVAPQDPDEMPAALDVRYSIDITHDVLLQLLRAEELTVRLGQVPIVIEPGESETAIEMLAYLEGDLESLADEATP